MNAQQLKNSILQMAVQGKLVPQDPNDEPASVLLEKIRAEKERLIKEGKIKKDKKASVIFRGADNAYYEKVGDAEPVCIDDQIPFDIPDSWEWVRLKSIAASINNAFADGPFGSNLKREHYTEKHEVRIIQLSNIGENGWRNENTKYTTYKHAETIPRSQVEPGSIVIAKMMPAGRAIIVPDAEKDYILSSDAVKFIPHKELIKEFLVFAINSPAFREQVVAEAHGVTRIRTSLGKIQTYLIPIPPVSEQERIVKRLKESFPKCDEYEGKEEQRKRINTGFPEQLKKSILQEAVQGKLVPQDPNDEPASVLLERIRAERERLIAEGKIKRDKHESRIFKRDNSHYELRDGVEVCIDDEIPFEIPESWEWARLSYFGVFSSGKTPTMADSQNWAGTIPWISSKDMKSKYINDSEMHLTKEGASSMRLYPKGTLLLVARSGILKRLLPLCILNVESTINQDIKAFSLYDQRMLDWLFYSIKAFEPMILRNLVKSVTTVESLKFEEFSQMLIPIPPRKEQHRIVDSIHKMMRTISHLHYDPLFSL